MFYKNKNGQAVIEYVALIIILFAGWVIFQRYILNRFNSRLKGVGDSMGYGRLYQPGNTLDCAFDYRYTNSWYSTDYYEQHCVSQCFGISATDTLCHGCYVAAAASMMNVNGTALNCDQL